MVEMTSDQAVPFLTSFQGLASHPVIWRCVLMYKVISFAAKYYKLRSGISAYFRVIYKELTELYVFMFG